MLTKNPIAPYDPKKMVRLRAVRGLFANGKIVESGKIFEVEAQLVADILVTLRAEFASDNDRHLVYKIVEHF